MKKAKDSKEYDAMLFEYIEKELGISKKKEKVNVFDGIRTHATSLEDSDANR